VRTVHVQVDTTRPSPLRRIWRYVGYDEPNYTYTPNGRSLLGKLGAMADAPYYIRAHFLLCSGDGTGRPKWGSTNAYTEDSDGNAIYSWDIVDRILDTYLEMGCTPFIELGFMPEALSTAPAGTPYDDIREGGWRYPPKAYGRWQELTEALALHCLSRYGLREVRGWYWELWNEPDIFYWAGTTEEYCTLYDYTAAGLLAVLPQARIGGPGTTNPSREQAGAYLRAFLEHCVHGTNAVTGTTGTRLDFISFHTKGGGYRRDVAAAKQTPTIAALVGHVDAGLEIIGSFPELFRREVILTECDPDGMAAYGKYDNANLQFRNTEYYASYVATTACTLLDIRADGPNRVDGMLTWAFQFENREYFEGLRTLATNDIDKPVLNVFRMLARLGNFRVPLASDGARNPLAGTDDDSATLPPGLFGIATASGDDNVQILLSSHHDDWDMHTSTEVHVDCSGLPNGARYRVRRSVIDAEHSNAHTVWVRMGEPQPPTAAQIPVLKQAAGLQTVDVREIAVSAGHVAWSVSMASHSVCLLELSRME